MGTKKKRTKRKQAVVSNELEFKCVGCGWSRTLSFDADEMVALNGNIRAYSGPCPKCANMTLIPMSSFVALAPQRELVVNMERDMMTLNQKVIAGVEEIARLRAEVAKQKTDLDQIVRKHLDEERVIANERDALRRENGRLKRIVKALKDAFVAATEEDAPTASPFGGR